MLQITISSRTAAFLLVVALLAFPAAALASDVFTDVDDANAHAEGIGFMKSSGVSVGCGDGSTYCPSDGLTRAQMGTFLYRFSGTDPNTPPSINAATLEGMDSSDFAPASTSGILGTAQIRANASIRNGSDSVVAVTSPSTGIYCIQFDSIPSQAELESSVVGLAGSGTGAAFVRVQNGQGGAACGSNELIVQISDGAGTPMNDRFSFMTPDLP